MTQTDINQKKEIVIPSTEKATGRSIFRGSWIQYSNDGSQDLSLSSTFVSVDLLVRLLTASHSPNFSLYRRENFIF